ncbi:MAG: helix-turn-helix domain-containing protein [Deltaproteobacteria bacterium]|nr:helix-turn-helix domain-containing protein [Deltaproteobacteria bacterium]
MRTIDEILEAVKQLEGFTKDAKLAELFQVRPNVVSTWRSRNTIPYKELIALCEEKGYNISAILTGEGPKYKVDNGGVELQKESAGFVFVPMVRGEISAGGGLVPDDTIDIRIAFRKDWILRKGDPKRMSMTRVSGDSMEPTLASGDMVLVDHSRDYIDPQGGIYAIAIDGTIMIKRLQVLYPSKKVRIISDNQRYETIETDSSEVNINGKVIWFGREIER